MIHQSYLFTRLQIFHHIYSLIPLCIFHTLTFKSECTENSSKMENSRPQSNTKRCENLTYLHFQSVDSYGINEFIPLLGFIFRNTADFWICFEIFDFVRLTTEINRLTRENRPPEKNASRNQKTDSIGNLTLNFYKMDN